MFDALTAGFLAIAADRVLLVIVIGAAVLAAWLVYEVVRLPRYYPLRVARPRSAEPAPVVRPSLVVDGKAVSERVEEIVQSLRERDDRTAKRRRKARHK